MKKHVLTINFKMEKKKERKLTVSIRFKIKILVLLINSGRKEKKYLHQKKTIRMKHQTFILELQKYLQEIKIKILIKNKSPIKSTSIVRFLQTDFNKMSIFILLIIFIFIEIIKLEKDYLRISMKGTKSGWKKKRIE